MAGGGKSRGDSLCHSGRQRGECSGTRKRGQHLAYQMPGPGSVARFLRHLLPVRKNTFEKSRAKRETLQCLTVQLRFANSFSLPSLQKV